MKNKILLILILLSSCGTTIKEETIERDLYLKIVAIQTPTDWQNGKFSGISKMWLLQSLRDTTQYMEWSGMSDSDYYSKVKGDVVHFYLIGKYHFFTIKKHK